VFGIDNQSPTATPVDNDGTVFIVNNGFGF